MTSYLCYCSYQNITLEDIKNCLNQIASIRAEIYQTPHQEVYVEVKIDGVFEFLNRFFVDVISLSPDGEIFPEHNGSIFYFESNNFPEPHPRLRDILTHILNTYGGYILDEVSPGLNDVTKGEIFYYWKNNIHLFRL